MNKRPNIKLVKVAPLVAHLPGWEKAFCDDFYIEVPEKVNWITMDWDGEWLCWLTKPGVFDFSVSGSAYWRPSENWDETPAATRLMTQVKRAWTEDADGLIGKDKRWPNEVVVASCFWIGD